MSNSKDKIFGYKLKNNKTGLYLKSFELNYISWSKKGKVWTAKGYLTSSIKRAISESRRYKGKVESIIMDEMGDWEIIELGEVKSYPMVFMVDKVITGGS
mgnify:CR=1 FL=1